MVVAYREMEGSPQEHISWKDGVTVVRTLRCAWSDRIQLAKELLGYTSGSIVNLPDKYDTGTTPLYYVWARHVDIEGIGINQTTGEWTYAKVTVTYQTTDMTEPSQPGAVTYITESLEPASLFLTLSDQKLWWADADPVDANEAPSVIFRLVDWVYTIHRVAEIPDEIYTLPGKINNAAVYSRTLDKTFPANTLLCGNPTLSREITSDGSTGWTVTFRFTYNRETWNKFPRLSTETAGDIAFETVYADSAAAKALKPYVQDDITTFINKYV